MALDGGRQIRWLTFAMLGFGSVATEIAVDETRPFVNSMAVAAAWVAVAAGLSRFVPTPKVTNRVPRWVPLLLVLIVAASFLVEMLRRGWLTEPLPLELQMVLAFRTLSLALAAFGVWKLCLRAAAVASLFLMLFAVTMTDHRAIFPLLALYSACGSAWLMLVYWHGLRQTLFMAGSPATVADTARARLPWLTIGWMIVLVAGVVGVAAAGPQRAARVLAEWLPTSGGTGDYDPSARGGRNDGDDETIGPNPNSTGFANTDNFLDSPLPSLYDMFNEQFGEPFRPKDREQAIALDGNSKINESKRPPPDNPRAGREFPTTRRAPQKPRAPQDRAARAIFEVKGRTPLHVRVVAFDHFDGVSWHECPPDLHTCLLEREQDRLWMQIVERTPPAIFADDDTHQIKLAQSLGTIVPTPVHLKRFHVGRVDRVDFFAWGPERILRMSKRRMPAGITIDTESRSVDPRRLNETPFPKGSNGAKSEFVQVPPTIDESVALLAQDWTKDCAPGWPQIDAVVQHLRRHYNLDRAAGVPDDCRNPVGHFLLESKRGPDYQFATAAAMLLRTLGYRSRVVSGFYVSPDRYDSQTRHTPVGQEDVHFWPEVMLPSGDWLVLEPTPGYEILGPNVSWSERLASALAAAGRWAWRHTPQFVVALAAFGLIWWRRQRLLDRALMLSWRWLPARTWAGCIQQTIRILERRGRWANHSRDAHQTAARWLHSMPAARTGEILEFGRMAEWAAYAPGHTPPWTEARVRDVCGCVLQQWTLRRWHELPLATNLGEL
ncbi:MAG TPA: transglutaminase domain-containing protein [Gemmataceae bacterium]|jgi:hypothetical protein|nr:transglutaminase domain-containing protein [Gemmataceae bacterium]